MKKSLPSRLLLQSKQLVKGALRTAACSIARGNSYRYFGLPFGLSGEMESKRRFVGLSDTTIYHQGKTIGDINQIDVHAYPPPEAPSYYLLEGGMTTNMGGQLTSSGRLVTTLLQLIDNRQPHQHDLFRFSTSRFRPRIYHTSQSVASCTTSWQGAFYHWLHEVLPRLAIYKKAGITVDRYFLEVASSFQRESLALLGIGEEKIINAAEYQAVSTPKLYASSITSQPTSWGCDFLRASFIPFLKKEARYPKRLYVSRADAPKRKVINEEPLVALLARYGFEKVLLTNYSFQEQMEFFYNAESIVAPHGAGLAHLAFVEPGTRLLELFAPPYVAICYWQLANVMKMNYHYLLSERREDLHPADPDLYLDLTKVERALKAML